VFVFLKKARRIYHGFALIAGLSLVALLLLSLLFEAESWPLTCAPMYADAVPEEAPRYRFRIMREKAGKRINVSAYQLGVPTLAFWG